MNSNLQPLPYTMTRQFTLWNRCMVYTVQPRFLWVQDDTHVLVMELCCTDLAAALDHAKVGWDEALIRGLLRQLLQGVAACHNTGPAPDTSQLLTQPTWQLT